MRTVAVVTVARSDYGLLRPVIDEIRRSDDLELQLVVGGMHLSEEHGLTVREIEADGIPIAARVSALPQSDEPRAIAQAIGEGVGAFAEAFAALRPDIVLVLGDRYEALAAVVGALPFALPVAHLHGGEATEGLIDDGIRNAITKLSHVHLASTETYARRIVQMGEEPWRVHVVGAPGLDAVRTLEPIERDELERTIGARLGDRCLLVTYHPVTLEYEHVAERLGALLEALDESGFDIVFTAPNADTSNQMVRQMIDAFVYEKKGRALVPSLGSRAYLSVLRHVAALVGNSSSGIIEAASFGLPVVNVGIRQQGRLRPPNVIDAGDDAAQILAAVRRATSDEFRAGFAGLENPYGDGHAAERVVSVLSALELGGAILRKPFHDLPEAG
jgi:UDP-N-acetylglucosamine 2-epimerase (non-hydrolysing)/GDP/UDP-N,N'-diacetylbacillosamine 2-epimerase (hydrolysing)